MQVLRTVYFVYSAGFILFAFRALSGVLVADEPKGAIAANRPGPWQRILNGLLRAALWPILIFRVAGIRQLFRGE